MDHPLVWIDLEMTGLDVDREVILEIATIVTDGNLDEVHEGPDLVLTAPEEKLSSMVSVVAEMHQSSGLLDEVRRSTLTVADAEKQTLEFVRALVPDTRKAPLAGNTVHADRAFIRRYMPELDKHLHYRHVDVSTVKELARRWNPAALDSAPDKAEGHRALDDIRESIAELRHYRRMFFRCG